MMQYLNYTMILLFISAGSVSVLAGFEVDIVDHKTSEKKTFLVGDKNYFKIPIDLKVEGDNIKCYVETYLDKKENTAALSCAGKKMTSYEFSTGGVTCGAWNSLSVAVLKIYSKKRNVYSLVLSCV